MPYSFAMRHKEEDHLRSADFHILAEDVADDGPQELKPQSELDSYQDLELACKEVASHTTTAVQHEGDTIDSQLSAHYAHSASSNLIGIGSGTQAAPTSLSQSLFRFSLSSDGDPECASSPDHSPTLNKDWIKEFERQAAAVDGISFQRAPASERRNPSEVPGYLKHVSERDYPTLKRAFVRCST
jgi:hypothetical protein